jgi:hypothetical protein
MLFVILELISQQLLASMPGGPMFTNMLKIEILLCSIHSISGVKKDRIRTRCQLRFYSTKRMDSIFVTWDRYRNVK